MAHWTPKSDGPVGKNDYVARRLFDEPMLAGLGETKPPWGGLNLRNFQEDRDENFSLDRVGLTAIDKHCIAYLLPRAHDAGTKLKPPAAFDGWSIVKARHLQEPVGKDTIAMPVVASPISVETEGETDPDTILANNKYHAHAVMPEKGNLSLALYLRHVFAKHGEFKKTAELEAKYGQPAAVAQPAAAPIAAEPVEQPVTLLQRFLAWVRGWFRGPAS